PPKGADPWYVAILVHVYDALGDYDSGIKLIDDVFLLIASKDPTYSRPESSAHAEVLMKEEKASGKSSYSHKIEREYLLIREAFEQDKAEGKKGCVGKKPGEVCLGRATQALIQSDYFPW
ncbi:MAG TPA: hypothetical protein DIS66_03200, partial [Candidatus Omnitrophica bacterium]|nr:hypothetical protein [Candidatus Omnitrophota bacterium]